MKPFANIDMDEVTRLTRAGKLAQAMDLLRSASPSAKPQDAPGRSAAVPDRGREDEARSSGTRRRGGGTGTENRASGPATLLQKMGALRDRLPGLAGSGLPVRGLGSTRPAGVVVPDGARFEERTFSSPAGSRSYKVFVPSGYHGQALPLVVMLHGCTQDPDDFARGTRMNEVAEEQTFLVVYPRQPQAANAQKCWNWFEPAHQGRGGGEPALLTGIALQVAQDFSADRSRIYVAGLSAGGAGAAVLASTHPDLFAALGVHSGLACGAARDLPSALAAMRGNGAVRSNTGEAVLPTIVFHGDRDHTVHPVNGEQVISQSTPQARLTRAVTSGEAGGTAYTRIVQADAAGRAVLEHWLLHGAGHAWSGGSSAGSYADPRGPDASREMVRFFFAHARADNSARP